uniref:NADH-ubiquinone oxidoreductase chain 6 n=1 Tax=Cavia porcellus TaxID=10141 RepID=Q9TEG0_CAVPO|nr:NADH dehydrogenase subunit 6 [Cavia porcellus]AJE26528.1 NADH dehydrogenase subunit 6 [Cavia porcellus]QIQ22943.1 NADH dehydrogenase subunit 6 [Cavia porcellus]CAB51829.1 NADH dehydrogenase subunit 6 [Cavia porcellus]
MAVNVMYFLSILFVMGFVCLSAKPSPVYGGLTLVVSGGIGCMLILSQGGSFLGLMVFLIYLGGMMVVFGYTTALATERYPETWASSMIIWGTLLLGLIMEFLLLYWWASNDQIEILVDCYNMGEWIIYDDESAVGFLSEDPAGVAAIYSYNCWLMFVAGWSMFVGIFIAIEITRGN